MFILYGRNTQVVTLNETIVGNLYLNSSTNHTANLFLYINNVLIN